jgi:hypothetical protein
MAPTRDDATGEGLLQLCISDERQLNGARLAPTETLDAMNCVAYISGAVEAVMTLFPSKPREKQQFYCIPTSRNIIGGQLVRVVLKWLRDHAEHLHEARITTVLAALRDTWPCK